MADWQTTTLGQFVSLQRGHDLPTDQRGQGNVPVMGSFGITGWHNVARANGPGVTVGRSGASIGVVSYIDRDYWPLNTCLFSTSFHGNNPRFVYYFLQTLDLATHNSGSAQPSLNRNYIAPIKINVPRPSEQDSIVNLLGSLDDKIELNRRMNETLEAMAQAIFRDWFVDFGPTRRRQDGATDPVEIMGGLVSDPDRARELAVLFPATLGYDGLPEGWGLRPLGELGHIAIGGLWGGDVADEKHDREFRCLRGVDLQHLRSEGHAPQTPKRFAKLQAIERRLPSSYDVLIASSGAGPCGRPLWVADDNFFMRHGPTIYSNFVKRITCRTPADACYLDRVLHNMRLSGEISAFIGGTSVPNLNHNSLLKTRMTVISPAALREAFLGYAVLVQQNLFSEQNRTLAATRDLLLPKLMSGEIRLRDAEAELEAAQ